MVRVEIWTNHGGVLVREVDGFGQASQHVTEWWSTCPCGWKVPAKNYDAAFAAALDHVTNADTVVLRVV